MSPDARPGDTPTRCASDGAPPAAGAERRIPEAGADLRVGPVRELDAGAAGELLADGARTGTGIVRRLVAEWHDGANRFDRPGEALFGAWLGALLVGVCGLNVDPYAGSARVGRVRHLYVLASCRRRGVGRALAMEVVRAARGRFDELRLRTSNPEAARLYRRLGFEAVAGAADHSHAAPLRASAPDPRGAGASGGTA